MFIVFIFDFYFKFDKYGNLIRWIGQPILLDDQIPRDSEALQLLEKYRPGIDASTKDVITRSKVKLDRNCRTFECNLGNFITDAWVYSRLQQYNGPGWTDASLAFINAGAIRSSAAKGNLTKYILSSVLPFNNELVVINVPGTVLKTVLELMVQDYVANGYRRYFLQMSGIHVVYNLKNQPGNRVDSVEVLCANCTIPSYEPLDEHKMYGIILDSFIQEGGDNFTIFKVSSFYLQFNIKFTRMNLLIHNYYFLIIS